ncbi:MAG: hypothetical protein ABJE95_30230 [Byssovorax sp.]
MIAGLLVPAGCAARATPSSGGGVGGQGGNGNTVASDTSSDTGVGGTPFDPAGSGGASATGSGGGVSAAYAHTNTTLFRFDPASPNLVTTKVGDFECIGKPGQDGSMTDLAVNDQGDLWGISSKSVYHLVPSGGTVKCDEAIPLANTAQVKFYGLTFAPVGVIDPLKEVLVAGNTDGELWTIDQNGTLSLHGNLGVVPADDGQGHAYPGKNQGKRWELSGDLVFLANGGKSVGFATVRDCPKPPSTAGCNPTDTLLEIDVIKLGSATTQAVTKSVRGQIVKGAGCNDPSGGPYGSMFGIAAWGSKVYGFSHSGGIVEIDNVTGGACLVKSGADLWDGAGVTTVAPVIAPPPPK